MKPYFQTDRGTLYCGDCLDTLSNLPDKSINCCVTSPPYWGLRNYNVDGQLGLEPTPEEYTQNMVVVFREVRRVLRDDGVCWLNLGDSYVANRGNTTEKPGYDNKAAHGGATLGIFKHRKDVGVLKNKDIVGIPWRVAFALQADGWYLRQDIIWHKPNPMPESVTDRCTKSHEYIFLLSKSERYFYDHEAIKEPAKWERWGNQTEKKNHVGTAGHLGGETLSELPIKDTKNKRSVWTIPTAPLKDAHFACFPPALITPCILAGCPKDGTVLDPFNGAGTSWLVSEKQFKNYVGIELNPEYCEITKKRIKAATAQLDLFEDTKIEAIA